MIDDTNHAAPERGAQGHADEPLDAARERAAEAVAAALRAGPSDLDVAAAVRRATDRAHDEGLVDVSYAQVDSPLGSLVAAATPQGLVRLAYEDFNGGVDAVLEHLAHRLSPRILERRRAFDPLRRELDEYFDGRRHGFDVPVDWSLTTGFTRRVLQATAAIPFGQVSTYREVADAAGNVRATRAAGNALGSNPLPIVVPCHRVLRTGGRLGGYTGGIEKKERLLAIEGVLL
ncbi:MAG TPA: methylated-DNA--[protein]-cysteine S-methyltransferase [Solirubrobacteraceae bacterium]|nr:methylated-DNA--[protein]-cysteine S-methyltransferase [Solirubrobacteraceae bacterium]